MTLPSPQQAERMTGTEVLDVLRQILDQERLDCARLADAMAERLVRSGKHDEARVAFGIAAQIRARGK